MPQYYSTHEWTSRTARLALTNAAQFAHLKDKQIDRLLSLNGWERPIFSFEQGKIGTFMCYHPDTIVQAAMDKHGVLCGVCLNPFFLKKFKKPNVCNDWFMPDMLQDHRSQRHNHPYVCPHCRHISDAYDFADKFEVFLARMLSSKKEPFKSWRERYALMKPIWYRFNPRRAYTRDLYFDDVRSGLTEEDMGLCNDNQRS